MKNTLVFATILIIQTLIAGCDPDSKRQHSLFDSSSESLKGGKLDTALGGFKELEKAGYKNSALYNNMADLFCQRHDFVLATLYYEKAFLLSPYDAQILHNDSLVLKKLGSDVVLNNIRYHADKTHFLKTCDLVNQLATWGFIIGAAILLISPLNSSVLKISFFKIFSKILIFVSLSIIILLLTLSFYEDSKKYAVVTIDNTPLYRGPSDRAISDKTFHKGLKVEIENRFNNWVKIYNYEMVGGWVYYKDLADVN